MEKEKKIMELYLKENILMDKEMEKEKNIMMILYLKVNILMEKEMEKEKNMIKKVN